MDLDFSPFPFRLFQHGGRDEEPRERTAPDSDGDGWRLGSGGERELVFKTERKAPQLVKSGEMEGKKVKSGKKKKKKKKEIFEERRRNTMFISCGILHHCICQHLGK